MSEFPQLLSDSDQNPAKITVFIKGKKVA